MINVQPYHDKLDKLQEWINLFIYKEGFLYVDMSCLPVMSPKELIQFFNETGCLLGNSFPLPKFIIFKEYCNE